MLLEDKKSSVATSLSVGQGFWNRKEIGKLSNHLESIVHDKEENSVEATFGKFLDTCNASSTNTICGDMLECWNVNLTCLLASRSFSL